MKEVKIIVGLGNAKDKYNGTRHNFGFEVIDNFTDKYQLKYNQLGTFAKIAKTKKSGYLRKKLSNQAVLGKPISFMNTSGPKVKQILAKLKAEINDLLVIYDDIDLDLGRIRIRPEGSAGGHNGIKSIIQSLGTHKFSRLKLGIGPQGDLASEDFVLNQFHRSELPLKQKVVNTAMDVIIDFCNKNIDEIMGKYNGINHVTSD